MKNLFVFFVLFMMFQGSAQDYSMAKQGLKLMGCNFEITAVASSDAIAWEAYNIGLQEIQRIESVISSWDPNSQTSLINRNAGIKAVAVDKELYDLIYRAKKVSMLTEGAFDISFASMGDIWNFDKSEQLLMDSSEVNKARAKIDWKKILLDPENTSVFLTEKGMKIGFGGIGKGYAANCAKELMSSVEGVIGGLVNASGDLIAWGVKPDGSNWRIQIADPKDKRKSIAWLDIVDMAVVTSGDYEKYFESNGKRYAHILNPKTGYPTTGIKSVTVICRDAELGDALATSIFALGREEGLALINRLLRIECIIITDDNSMYTSKHLKLNYHEN